MLTAALRAAVPPRLWVKDVPGGTTGLAWPRSERYSTPMRTADGYRKCRRRYEGLGHARYLTFSCYHNQPFLRSERACHWLRDATAAARDTLQFDLWAWVLMPDHVHLLLHPCGGTAVGSILRAIKEPVSRHAAAWVRKNAPDFLWRMEEIRPNGRRIVRFWQPGGGYDRNIHSAEELHEKIDYIHRNPVRAGLVEDPAAWPWSSYSAWHDCIDGPLPIDRTTLPPIDV